MRYGKETLLKDSLFKDGVLLFVATFCMNYFVAEICISLTQIIMAISWIITIIFFIRNTVVAKINYIEGEWKSYIKSFLVGLIVTIILLLIFVGLKDTSEYSYDNMAVAGMLIIFLIVDSVKRYFLSWIIGFIIGKIYLVKDYN